MRQRLKIYALGVCLFVFFVIIGGGFHLWRIPPLPLPPDCLRMNVLTPTPSPSALTSGPPELPGLIGASVAGYVLGAIAAARSSIQMATRG